jgi:hypothetical protein
VKEFPKRKKEVELGVSAFRRRFSSFRFENFILKRKEKIGGRFETLFSFTPLHSIFYFYFFLSHVFYFLFCVSDYVHRTGTAHHAVYSHRCVTFITFSLVI